MERAGAGDRLELGILGSFTVSRGGAPVAIGGPKPRSVLAVLVLRAGQVVPAERLIDDLWEADPPRSASATLQTYVSQLRKRLGPDSVRSSPGGYRIDLDDDALDATAFELALDAVRGARDAEPRRVIDELDRALALWRGAALVDFAGATWAAAESTRLEELRLVATEIRIDARLAVGDHAAVVADLEPLVEAYPFRERFWGQLMLALYRGDRQADALRAYGRLRNVLGDELGIVPSRELERLERAILLHESALDLTLSPPQPVTDPGGGQPTRVLPSGVVTFLLTDIVGSSVLWDRQPVEMAEAIAIHDTLVAEVVEGHSGHLIKPRGEGDSTFSVFERGSDAIAAGIELQQQLGTATWPPHAAPTVRIALHTGQAVERDGDYYGTIVNRAARLRSMAGGGQILVSQATAEVVADHVAPDVELVAVGTRTLRGMDRPERVYAVLAPGVADGAPLAPTGIAGVARSLNRFVGRAEEVADITARLEPGAVVTIVASGGTGKTRLAQEVALQSLTAFPDGVHFVRLEDVGPDDVVSQVSFTVLGGSPLARAEGGADPLAMLVGELAGRRTLVVLDNCEHVVRAAAGLVQVLVDSGDGLSILATSRERLNLAAEQVFALQPLAVERPGRGPGDTGTISSPAAELFCERAAAADPGFVASAENLAVVEEICRALEGLPLAIELAAARVRTITLQRLASRLSNQLTVLRQDRSSRPTRHRSLEQAIAWSFDLLDAAEQKLLAWVSVFAGGFSVEAIEHLAAAAALGDEGLDLLESLCDKSLVTRDRDDAMGRYRVAVPIRQFAEHRLEERGERDEAEVAHLAHFEARSREAAAVGSRGLGELELADLRADNDNFVAAIHRAAERGRQADALRMAIGLHPYWEETGSLAEATRLIESVVGDDLSDPVTLQGIGVLLAYAPMCGNIRRATELADLLTPTLELSLPPEQADRVRFTLGFLYSARGDLPTAIDLWCKAGRDVVAVDANLARQALYSAGQSATHAGRFDEARLLLDEASEIPPPAQSWFPDLVRVNRALIDVYQGRGQVDELLAGAHALDALGLRFRLMLGAVDTALGLHHAGAHREADEWGARVLDISLEMGNIWSSLTGLEFAAWTAAERGEDRRASRIWGCIDRFAAERGYGQWDLIAAAGAERRRDVRARSPVDYETGVLEGSTRSLHDMAMAVLQPTTDEVAAS